MSRARRPNARSTKARNASSALSTPPATLAIAQVCEQRQVPLIVNIGAAPQLTEQGYKFLVRNFPTGGMLVNNGLKQIKALIDATKITPKTAVFLHANDNFGMAQRKRHGRAVPQGRAAVPTARIRSPTIRRRRISRSRSPRSAASIPICCWW